MAANDVYIVSAVRTPVGTLMGTLANVPAHDLGSVVLKEAIARAKLQPNEVDEVILGQVLTAGQGQNPARHAAVKAGIPLDVPAYMVSMLCGSSLRSIASACQSIKAGDSKIVVCGGQESMSLAPHTSYLRSGTKLGDVTFKDHMMSDGLTDVFHNYHMGITVENVVSKYKISREEQDELALDSQMRAKKAIEAGYFKDEIVPVVVPGTGKNAQPVVFTEDEHPRKNITLADLKKLEPRFKEGGSVTAGNASGMNDAAAALVLMSKEEALRRKAPAMARVVAHAQTGCDPQLMGIGPVGAVEAVLKKTGWKREEVDLYELNEAYAGVSIAVMRDLRVDPAKVNAFGGAIALGHPLGASGSRVLVTLVHQLKRTGGKKGIAAVCVGGGMGVSVAVEML